MLRFLLVIPSNMSLKSTDMANDDLYLQAEAYRSQGLLPYDFPGCDKSSSVAKSILASDRATG